MQTNTYTFISGTTYEVDATNQAEAYQKIVNYFDDIDTDLVTECEAVTDFYGVQPDAWDEPNQLNYTLEQLQKCYDTAEVLGMLNELMHDGYTGLSLGLIIDLIKQRCEAVN